MLFKKAVSLAFGSALVFASGAAFADADFKTNCAEKEKAVMRNLEYAKAQGNSGRIQGLEKALSQVRRWCTEENLLAKAELKVMEKQEKVQEREEELAEATAEGKDADKLAERKMKLEEAKAELREAEQERDAVQP